MINRLNILFVSTFYPKQELLQYCQFVHEEAKALTRKGYSVTVINPRNDIRSCENWTLEGIPVLCLPYRTWRTNYSYIMNSFFLFKALKQLGRDYFLNFDFIHVHNCLPEGNAVQLLKKEFHLEIPMAVQVHDPNIFKGAYIKFVPVKHFFRKYCTEIYEKYDYCIGVSNMVSNLIRSCLPADMRQKVVTSYNGYNPSIFNITPKVEDTSQNPLRILFVGNLIEWKGIRSLIHAYCQCFPSFSVPTEMWILGRGPLEKEMKTLVRSYRMENHIFFKGYVLPEKVAEYMNLCDIYAMPSTFEGFGCVYIEAMACGLPCIACTGQGISEIIESEKTGILIPPDNLDVLKSSLLKLVNYPEIRMSYKENISQMIDRHIWDNAVAPIDCIYKTAAASSDS